jgi:hypothetical protein
VAIVIIVVDDVLITSNSQKNSSLWMSFWREPLRRQQKWRVDFSDKKYLEKLGGNIVPIGKNLAGTTNLIGTRTGIGIRRNWVKKGSGIGNSPEFSGIPLGIHNQATGGRRI